jgi:tetratricopeptide (TPR) repeat protein
VVETRELGRFGPLVEQIARLEAAKSQGNAHVVQRQFEEAIAVYREATQIYLTEPQLGDFPEDLAVPPPPPPPAGATEETAVTEAAATAGEPVAEALSPEEAQINLLRAQTHSNAALALVTMQRHQEAIEQCTYAVTLDPQYLKAYFRRGQCYEALGQARSAVADYKKCLELDPAQVPAQQGVMRVGPAAAEEERRQVEEMKTAFKGLANKFLGLFNLSTDNFQMVQDPATGGYSVNFQQAP